MSTIYEGTCWNQLFNETTANAVVFILLEQGFALPRGRRRGIRGLAIVAIASFAAISAGTNAFYHPGTPRRAPAAAGSLPASSSSRAPRSTRPTSTPGHAQPSPLTPEGYYASASRNALIGPIVEKFGELVVSQSESHDSGWGSFDAFCRPASDITSGGYVSQGYAPRPGDICVPQHNPQYGGGNGEGVSADVIVGSNGKYTDRIVGAGVIMRGCDVTLNGSDSEFAPTVASIKSIDAAGLACLEEARP